MKLINTLVLTREDLGEGFTELSFTKIDVIHFPFFNTGVVLSEDMVVFIDTTGDTKILKNRLGKPS